MSMIRISYSSVFLAMALPLSLGCGQVSKSKSDSTSINSISLSGTDCVLSAEPVESKGVIEVRKVAKDGDEVVITGRVGGSTEPIVKGRASFTIVDTSFVACSEREGDDCKTPWDFCCESREDLAKGTV